MRRGAATLSLFILTSGNAFAIDQAMVRQFEKLDPQTRLEQRCDTEAMERITRGKTSFKADKVIAYAFSDPNMDETRIEAPGAVFRSQGEWYRLAFRCRTEADRIGIVSFSYQIGARVPHGEWRAHNLYP
ncbi:DUF930 domain-containing protein [Rhizobium sp. YIM 134829]|uniref:DUF930 domain-containing protein n=1 Tax=Rhizobium sp. YIM 134829 TaxID=3390453 RepID=UPI00397D18F1